MAALDTASGIPVSESHTPDDLDAARLLLSVSPQVRPISQPPHASMKGLDALESLADLASLESPAIDDKLKLKDRHWDNEEGMCPAILGTKYARIYNKNGRIGIYTKEERYAIIHRYRSKRIRRVWRKTIRYNCRKNLADQRIRVKGRFVKISRDHDNETVVSESSRAFDDTEVTKQPTRYLRSSKNYRSYSFDL